MSEDKVINAIIVIGAIILGSLILIALDVFKGVF